MRKVKIMFLGAGVVLTEVPQEPLPFDTVFKTSRLLKSTPRMISTTVEPYSYSFEDQRLLGYNQPIAMTFADGTGMIVFGRGKLLNSTLEIHISNLDNGTCGYQDEQREQGPILYQPDPKLWDEDLANIEGMPAL